MTVSRIFVYGTLKRGQCRAHVLREQQFVGDARTVPAYRMFDCGSYPGLVADSAGIEILGEVWDVQPDCLVQLDLIEGLHVGLYARRPIQLREPFADQCIESYFYLHSTAGRPDCGSTW